MGKILVASSHREIRKHLRLALEYGCGLELQAFANPDLLDEGWEELLRAYRPLLRDFPHPLTLHGAFFDLTPASMDRRVVALTEQRYMLSLDIAAELGASLVIFHTNFFPMIRSTAYRRHWTENQTEFWRGMAEEAEVRGLSIAIENMWDPDPYVLRDLVLRVQHPRIAACLDVSHICLYQNGEALMEEWFDVLEPYVVHIHINNTQGVLDQHLALDVPQGAIDYTALVPRLLAFEREPALVVEISDPDALERSLVFLDHLLGSRFGKQPAPEETKP